jgi:fatty-acyl-CoA synthase
MIFRLLYKLYKIRLLSVVGIFYLLRAIRRSGTNLMTLLDIATALHPKSIAVSEASKEISYPELAQQATQLATALYQQYHIRPKMKIAIACRNHSAHLKAIFAISRIGAHQYLLNPEMTIAQFQAIQERHQFDFIIYDTDIAELVLNLGIPSLDELAIDKLSEQAANSKAPQLKRASSGKLVVLTGGSTGTPKSAARKPSIFDFLPPLFALLQQVELDKFKSVFIATPIYHGFGVASIFTAMVLGAEMHLLPKFEAKTANIMIANHKIEVVTLVPLMLQRMLLENPKQLLSLKRIIAGGAPLSPTLAQQTIESLGLVLYNLYGTSEAGFCILSTAQDLQQEPTSIGRAVQGVRLKILDAQDQALALGKVGHIAVRSSWSINKKSWIKTGDVGYLDKDGRVFLCGRIDDMIVSGGENVYPIELENILAQHPDIEIAAVIGVADAEFGQRLKAFVVLLSKSSLDKPALLAWLKPRVARYQMPVDIEFRERLPLTALDKIDKKKLY